MVRMPQENQKRVERPKQASNETSFGFEYIILLLLILLFAGVFGGGYIFGPDSLRENIYVARFILAMKIISSIVGGFSLGGIIYVVIKKISMGSLSGPVLKESVEAGDSSYTQHNALIEE